MSQENVEIVRRLFEAAASRDSATVLDLYDRDVECDFSHHAWSGVLGQTGARGHEELRRFFREWYESFESLDFEIRELIEMGDHVISLSIFKAVGRTSGAGARTTDVGVWTVREGKVVRVVWLS